MSGLFHVCQGTCMCASAASDSYAKGKVLYCYGEVVLQRSALRKGAEDEDEMEGEMFALQMAQLVAVALLLIATLIVLISIRHGLKKIHGQMKKILFVMSSTPKSSTSNTLEKKKVVQKTPNGDCPKYSEKDLQAHGTPGTPAKSVVFASSPVETPRPHAPPFQSSSVHQSSSEPPSQPPPSFPPSQPPHSLPPSQTPPASPLQAFVATLVQPVKSSSPSSKSSVNLTSSPPFPSSPPLPSSPVPSFHSPPISQTVPSSPPISIFPSTPSIISSAPPHLSAIQSLINEVQNDNFNRPELTPPLPSPPPSPPKYLPPITSSPILPPPPPPYFCSSSPSPTYTLTCPTALQTGQGKVVKEGILKREAQSSKCGPSPRAEQTSRDDQSSRDGQSSRDDQSSSGPKTPPGIDHTKTIYRI